MTDVPIIPVVGSAGFYRFKAPFDTSTLPIQYTCKAVRKISDYLANNEDVKNDVYVLNKIEDTWDNDVQLDVYIVSLQAATGHWLYVPYQYILSYPSGNGKVYRSVVISISAPALPAEEDLTALTADLLDMANYRLGLTCKSRLTESSKPTLVDHTTHTERQLRRNQAALLNGSLTAQLTKERAEKAAALAKIAELEQYIATTIPPQP